MQDQTLAANVTETEPDEGYKNLQRQLEKERTRSRQFQRDALTAARSTEENKQLRTGLRELIIAVRDGADEKVEEVLSEFDETSKAIETASGYQQAVMSRINDADSDWADEELEPAREAWDRGDFEGAVREVEKALGTGTASAEETKAEVAKQVKQALRDLGMQVDTGMQTAGQTRRLTVGDAAGVGQAAISNPSDGKAAAKKLLDDLYPK